MASTSGRRVVVPLTNKSGGGVIAGDVVIIDTSNDEAFTTTTTAAYTGGVGVAQETIANNATGRVLIAGYAALVNVSASVTRGQYGTTHTVAKQAVGTASRGAGTFAQWLTGGTTPTARIFAPDLAAASGNVAADGIWDAAGDLAVGTGADTAAKLTKGTAGKVLVAGSSTVSWEGFHGVGLNHSVDLTISNGSEAALAMDTEIFDTDGYHDTVTNNNRITIPTGLGGYYQLNINIRPDGVSGAYVVARLNVTNGTPIIALASQTPTGPVLYTLSCSTIVNLAAGDFLWFGQSGNVGGPKFYSGNANGPKSWVTMVRLGV